MKKRLLAVGLLVLLALLVSCASMPAPEGPDDSLVIGYFAMSYPDGFFDQGKHTFTSGINLYFTNQTTGRKFWLTTSNGYFQFLSNGTDSYSLDSYKLSHERGSSSGDLDHKFATKPRSVIYLGDLTLIYSKPKKTFKTSIDQKTVYWQYERSSSFTYNEGQLLSYLRDKDPESPWLQYEVVH